jgi:hypothetical protein
VGGRCHPPWEAPFIPRWNTAPHTAAGHVQFERGFCCGPRPLSYAFGAPFVPSYTATQQYESRQFTASCGKNKHLCLLQVQYLVGQGFYEVPITPPPPASPVFVLSVGTCPKERRFRPFTGSCGKCST